jgi:aminopeptidase-like protein
MNDGEYEVFIDSTLTNGSLSYGEYFIEGKSQDEVLFSTHVCHPSMCNDNLSGVVLCAFLARYLREVKPYYSYRFLFVPGTIGSISWLSQNKSTAHRIKHGLVVACVGDGGKPTYKKSRRGTAVIDTAVIHILRHTGKDFDVKEFVPYGYDERQYCSPAFNLAVGSLTRTPHGCFPQYHTSADNLEFVLPEHLAESFGYYAKVVYILENNKTYISTNQQCEPQLGRRGLYNQFGGRTDAEIAEMALLWVLNLSDGNNSLLDIAERSVFSFERIREAAILLEQHGLLEEKVL